MLKKGKDFNQQIVKYNSQTGEEEVLITKENLTPKNLENPLAIYKYSFSSDLKYLLIFTNTKKVWRRNTRGDYWILNRITNELKKLGGDAKPSTLMFATISADNKSVAYVRENNIYIESIEENKITQLTFDGSTTIINGTFDWVYEEELSLRKGFRWSPDGNKIAFWQLDAEGVGVFNMINNTDSIYSKIIPVQYPKVGTTNSACKVGVVEISSKKIIWFKIPGKTRNNYIARMDWAESSEEVIIQQLNRLQNHNRVYIGNALDGSVNNIFTDKDDAWVDVVDNIKWFKNGKYFTWLSEKDGWRHVYIISRDGKEVKIVTKGNYDVISVVGIDKLNEQIYFIASPNNATQSYLFRKSIFTDDAKELITPVTNKGFNSYNISPNFKWAIHIYSNINHPNKIDFVNLPSHKVIRELVKNEKLENKLSELNIKPAEFFKINIEDNVQLDAFKILPPNFNPKNKYPVLFYVYGEPAAQTVLDRWSRNYLWHQMLTQNGYIVISIDNRGTPAPKGREWRKYIYGNLGKLTTADQAEAAKRILEWDFVDSNRIGVWGWSGGGSMSLNAIFRYPKIYKTAVAVAPVTDEKLYDTIYEERYMGLPSSNAKGYKEGSPITYANQLEGNLLLIHGTGDDNVHYQNTEMLINELIKHNKIFSVVPYPNRSHSIFEGKNTYRHVFETIFDYLKKNL